MRRRAAGPLGRATIAAAALLISSFTVLPLRAEAPAAAVVAGWVERVFIRAQGEWVSLKAKLDTGARTSSLDAPGYRVFDKDGAAWVSFELANGKGEPVAVSVPVTRTVQIRRAGAGVDERPVIELEVCLGGVRGRVEFTLADRSAMTYPVLVGRRFLAGRVLVDPGRTFLAAAVCTDR